MRAVFYEKAIDPKDLSLVQYVDEEGDRWLTLGAGDRINYPRMATLGMGVVAAPPEMAVGEVVAMIITVGPKAELQILIDRVEA